MNAKKLLALLLALAMTLSMSAVAFAEGNVLAADVQPNLDELDIEAYDELSAQIYDLVLGEFYEAYQIAKAEIVDLDVRMGLMAVAEAKLMESGMILPNRANGGSYAITRIAPNTVCTIDWGYDADRYDNIVIANELITSEDRAAMNALFAELRGTGTYEQAAKDYLLEHGYTLKTTYDMAYSADPLTWDWNASSRSTTGEPTAPLVEGLLKYDIENVQKPNLATSYEVSEDGLTYTFHIREGVKWVDYQGREVDDVQADDWVAALQHEVDSNGGLAELLTGVILNLDKYIAGEVTDFSEVGVKAEDKYTLVYTLAEPAPWLTTLTGYSALAPMCRSFYESLGGTFGLDTYNPDTLYGTDPQYIAYCGAYIVTSWVQENSISYVKNESYWNADEVDIVAMNWKYNDGTDVTKAYNDCKAGVTDSCALNTNVIETSRTEIPEGQTQSYYDLYHYISRTDATSFVTFFNANRMLYANFNDPTVARSTRTVAEAERTYAALQNVHFRRAICFALDRGAYHAQQYGEELKYGNITNSYTPGAFMSTAKEITIDINGTPTTFPANTWYGEIMQAQINADGVKIQVWDPNGNEGIGSSTQYDGWFNPANAVEELTVAIEELAAAGVEVSPENPLHIEYAYYSSNDIMTNRANVVKQSIENSLNGNVVVDLVDAITVEDYRYTSYNCDYGYQGNFDFNDGSGWGPDYGDAQTFLDTILPDYNGYMTKVMGVF